MKDFMKIFLISLAVAIGYGYLINYESETIRLEKELESKIINLEHKVEVLDSNVKFNDYRITYEVEHIEPEIDYLTVPENPINYWTEDETKEYRKRFQTKKSYDKFISNIDISIITEYIKEKEGFHSTPYRDGCLIKAKKCPVSKYRYSNGYGTLAKSKNEKISKIEAEKRLMSHVKQTIYPKIKNVKFKSMAQVYASIDFAYNAGHNAFANNIVNNNLEVDCAKMMDYVNFNGKENKGLSKRRFENFIQCISIEI